MGTRAATGRDKTKVTKRARAAAVSWPPTGGTLDEVLGVYQKCALRESAEERAEFAVIAVSHGDFQGAGAAIDKERDPWNGARIRARVALAALADATPPGTEARELLRRWLLEADTLRLKAEPNPETLVFIGASWVLLGEVSCGEPLLAAALKGLTEDDEYQRETVAVALAKVERIDEAIAVLCGGETIPREPYAPITARASVAQLLLLLERLSARGRVDDYDLYELGLARLLAFRAWPEARRWIEAFERIGVADGLSRICAARAAAGDPAGAEAMFAERLGPGDPYAVTLLGGLAQGAPERARPYVGPLVDSGEYNDEELARVAARAGALDQALKIDAGLDPQWEYQIFEVRRAVVRELAVDHPDWRAWFDRAHGMIRDHFNYKDLAQMAAQAARGGLSEVKETLLARAIAQAKGDDLDLESVCEEMAAVGDLAGAHRAWMAIKKKERHHRVAPLLAACAANEHWAAVVDLLGQLPSGTYGRTMEARNVLQQVLGARRRGQPS